MGFFGKEPVNENETKAYYVWTGLGTPGYFYVEVKGDAPNYSSGFQLMRDTHFVGGLKIDSMGWTGPLGEGTQPYKSVGTFHGMFLPEIIVSGTNGNFTIKVEEIAHTEIESFLKSRVNEPVNA